MSKNNLPSERFSGKIKGVKERPDHEWMITNSGAKFWPAAPIPSEICIEDVAHALSNICRFGGHVNQFYSVAQHSVLVSRICPPEHRLAGLLHDATEAYCGDIIRPIKINLRQFNELESVIWAAVCSRFNLPENISPVVKWADNTILMTEKRDLTNSGNLKWGSDLESYKPLPEIITPLCPEKAKLMFLTEFANLTKS